MAQKLQKKLLGQVLKEMNVVSEYDIQQTLREQKEKGGTLGKILVDKGLVTQDDLHIALGLQAGMERVDLDQVDIASEVIELVPANFAENYGVIPVAFDGSTLQVALLDPFNIQVLDDLKFIVKEANEVKAVVANPDAVKRAIDRYYAGKADSIAEMFGKAEDFVVEDKREELGDVAQLERDANATPVVKLLNMVLLQAIKDRGSDIHFEPFEREFKIRYRVDGVLYEMMPPPLQLARAVISRIKVMSNLDIAETRLPQDGRIELTIGGRPVDLRVSTLPTMFGESVVLRVLDRSNVALDLERIGLRPDELRTFRALLQKPDGIVLVTGPTGSGKTTTLYSALQELNTVDMKVITTEDPVEYDIDGLIQVPINDELGVTFAACLRSILRQDPDVILVGEIRDLETAQIAVESSLTGHIVFSTLHTNDAPSSVTRIVDLGLEPFLLTATLEAIIAQRLVRRICMGCRTEYEPTDEELFELELTRSDVIGRTFFYGKGCKDCNGTGYRGRIGLFEFMVMTDRLRELIMTHASTAALRKAAQEDGMRTLRESGLLHIFDGITTIEEVVRETISVG
jgi:type IV pilus assembly protein PilB